MQIKKMLCLFLCLTMLTGMLAGCGNRESTNTEGSTPKNSENTEEITSIVDGYAPPEGTLSESLDVAQWQDENRSEIMDFAYYLSGELSVGDGGECHSRRFDWDEDKKPILLDYIELLCTKYDFEQVGNTYDSAGFFDVVLRYTGDNSGPDQSMEGIFSGNMGDVHIWYTTNYGDIEGYFSCDDSLIVGDDGYRYGQSELICTLPGESAGAGLEYCDGVYRTTDGRLSTTLDHAVLLTDGQVTDYNAHYEISSGGDRFTVRVEDDYGNNIQVFYLPSLVGWGDGFTPIADFVREQDYVVNRKGIMESYPTYNWETMFTTIHNYQYVVPAKALAGEMDGLTFRVMYRDKNVIVFYTCATFRSAPTTVEALIAVNMDVEFDAEKEQVSSDSSGENTCLTCSGSGNCKECGGDGRVNEWTGREYMNLTCTRCGGSGNCSWCYGSGKN